MRSSGEQVSAGFNHVEEGHFNRPITPRNSVFRITPLELGQILQSKEVVRAPVSCVPGGQFSRTVDIHRIIGTTNLRDGGQPTSRMQIFTDHGGNLITAYPVP